jgi:hypothetical protein
VPHRQFVLSAAALWSAGIAGLMVVAVREEKPFAT